MDSMKIPKKIFGTYFASSATIHMQSTPAFLGEFVLFAVVFLLLIIQHLQVGKISKRCLRLKPYMIYSKIKTGSRRKEKEPAIDSKPGLTLENGNLHLANLTPEQYAKMEKERQAREREFDNGMQSLSTLCRTVVRGEWSGETFKSNFSTLKENIECKSATLEGKYLGHKAADLSESLINVLENSITSSSVETPFPFKGDIATLAVDAAELLKIK
ncbi:hypothetical protein PPYR_00606 [Photinus pyralis]|uniref:Uncharacterized protein n=2 Tax=Photinus pyralis TaxID=7054 RepID=A0A5N4B248_PHOPY|nr:uncharacterized protein LOC116159585 [Photinus pyralis]KAB0803636.1 hypothetical protein PPYR_00606 [Photinus pyralis]